MRSLTGLTSGLVILSVLIWIAPRQLFASEIHDAARNGDLAKVQALLKENPALVFSKDDRGATPLHYAAAHGYKEVVELLLANNADVNAKTELGYTALYWAADAGHLDTVRALIRAGADVNAKNVNDGGSIQGIPFKAHRVTALMQASADDQLDVVRELIGAKAEVNSTDAEGETALIWASQSGHADVVQLLLESGADANVMGGRGYTRSITAWVLGKSSSGTDEHITCCTALMYASEAGHSNVVQALLDAKVNRDTRDADGTTALMFAAKNGRIDVVRALIKGGADLNIANNSGQTALILAKTYDDPDTRRDRLEIIRLLIEAGDGQLWWMQ
jgi:ankyrin repeat protein